MSLAAARRVFFWAGVYGLVVMLPQYFLEARIGADSPPAITHPEYFYGFVGVVIAFQLVFLVIAKDVVRYRLLMVPAMVEKITFVVAVIVLYFQHRVPDMVVGFAAIDSILFVLFGWAFLSTRGVGTSSSR